jgi:ribosomal peptide maturation radical SAM protein 1
MTKGRALRVELKALPSSGDILLVLPPFASIDRPSYGLHLLQALAARERFRASVLYANIHFARVIGEELYTELCYGETSSLTGEKVFAAAAFGALEPPGKPVLCHASKKRFAGKGARRKSSVIKGLDRVGKAWACAIASAIAKLDYPIVGCNAMFEQTTAVVAMFRRLKRLRPDMTLIVGGALCEGPMARAMHALTDSIDHVFSGESETTFVDFLRRHRDGRPLGEAIVVGEPCMDLEGLPNVDYADYFAQLGAVMPRSALRRENQIWLPYEGSRGCWWGQKHHCTFCGINGTGMTYRQKSAHRVQSDLTEFAARYPARKVLMLDNIMPHRYFQDLLPNLAQAELGLDIFYEQKANLTFRRMSALSDAGVSLIQPGIEALADDLLKLMKKGVQARQNIAALRFARACDVSVNWNILYAFPGDDEADYRQTTALIPLMAHLNPPTGLCHLSIDRFSPYHEAPQRYGIAEVRPMAAYSEVYPPGTNLTDLAYHFGGDYDTAARRAPELVAAMDQAIEDWRGLWAKAGSIPPTLAVRRLSDETFIIADTRACRTKSFHLVDRAHAMMALTESTPDHPLAGWALDSRLAVQIRDVIVPLAVADRALFADIFDTGADSRQTELAA